MKHIYFFTLLLCGAASAQIVNIPDANFKNALINSPCVYAIMDLDNPMGDADTNDDGEIQVSEAAAIFKLVVNGQGISSLSGIEYFTGLWMLECADNQLTSLDVSACETLAWLDCSNNQLTLLAVNFQDDMEYDNFLDCSNNAFTSFTMPDGPFDIINLSQNPLTQLNPGGWIRSLNLNETHFTTFGNSVSAQYLQLSNCPYLTSCNVNADNVTVLNNPLLITATFGSSGTYNVHNNPLLESISIKDGIVGLSEDLPVYHNFTGNPSLLYVCVDDLLAWFYEGEWVYNEEINHVGIDPGVTITYYCDLTPGGNYNTVTGNIKMDGNGDGCDASDQPAANLRVKIMQGAQEHGVVFTEDQGQYTGYLNSGVHTLVPETSSPYFAVAPDSYTTSFTGTGNTATTDFCIVSNQAHNDLEIAVIPLTPSRPGFDATYRINYLNKGTETQSGTIALTFEDDILDLISSTPTASSQSENILTWSFSDLVPFESREVTLVLNLNSPLETPAVNNGDILDFTAVITGAVDETPIDNTFALSETVVGSFDPNDKIVSRENIGISQLEEFLYYTVRFQNTGTFYAENVVVRDELPENLDFSTLEIVATSHPCRTLLTKRGNNANLYKLEFFFEGINLPASIDDEPASHGFVTFKVKPKSTLVIDDQIKNTAEIYFDFNAPIVTNEVTTTVTVLGLGQRNHVSAVLYPNPAGSNFSVELPADNELLCVSIHNALGQLVKKTDAQSHQAVVDISTLIAGTYFVTIETGKGKTVKKLMKL